MNPSRRALSRIEPAADPEETLGVARDSEAIDRMILDLRGDEAEGDDEAEVAAEGRPAPRRIAARVEDDEDTEEEGDSDDESGAEEESGGFGQRLQVYDDLLADWRKAMASASSDLGIALDLGPDASHPVDEFIDPELSRHLERLRCDAPHALGGVAAV